MEVGPRLKLDRWVLGAVSAVGRRPSWLCHSGRTRRDKWIATTAIRDTGYPPTANDPTQEGIPSQNAA